MPGLSHRKNWCPPTQERIFNTGDIGSMCSRGRYPLYTTFPYLAKMFTVGLFKAGELPLARKLEARAQRNHR